jgi:hypothetical protein
VQALGRARRLADEKHQESGRERIKRAAVTDAPRAEDAAGDDDDVMRGPALGLIDREDAGERRLLRLSQAIPSATG